MQSFLLSILSKYVTMFPLILGGVSNMVFTKTRLYKRNKYPIDGYITLKDGKRIFGENKTVIGFVSMILFIAVYQVVWGEVCGRTCMEDLNDWYITNSNNIGTNIITGTAVGIIYMISELPNSFVKRRLGIPSGRTPEGKTGFIFFVTDQIDSLIGVFLFLAVYSKLGIGQYFGYLALGGITHIAINLILYKLKVRKNL